MYSQDQLKALINKAQAQGAVIVVTNDFEAEAFEGRLIIESVKVLNAWEGIVPNEMTVIGACERLSQAFAE